MTPKVECLYAPTNLDPAACARYAAHLSDDENRLRDSFRLDRDRRRFIIRRGILRELLGERLHCSPRKVAIACDSFGKPYVPGSGLAFNVSRSQDLALFAFGAGVDIGCDIEAEDGRFATWETAEQFLSAHEIAAMRSLAPQQWTNAFFRYWTAKEAYLKARGTGLLLDPRTISVRDGDRPHFMELPGDTPSQWSFSYLPIAKGFVAALAVRGPCPAVRCRRFDPDRVACPIPSAAG